MKNKAKAKEITQIKKKQRPITQFWSPPLSCLRRGRLPALTGLSMLLSLCIFPFQYPTQN
ncbi:hypothetical protein ACOSP7_015052 [Xanthoceras sorbifolium]